jgi:hypothetical protein
MHLALSTPALRSRGSNHVDSRRALANTPFRTNPIDKEKSDMTLKEIKDAIIRILADNDINPDDAINLLYSTIEEIQG